MELNEIIAQQEERMNKSIDALKHKFASIRTGRASTALLDGITVDYYGTPSPINQVANISVPEPRMIVIAPWDKSMMPAIEKAIMMSDLGLNPNNDGEQIRLAIPQLTEERRKELVKQAKGEGEDAKISIRNARQEANKDIKKVEASEDINKEAEDAKVAVRNIRRDANDALKKEEKAKTITEDDAKNGQDKIQKVTDKFIKTIDDLRTIKEKDVLEV